MVRLFIILILSGSVETRKRPDNSNNASRNFHHVLGLWPLWPVGHFELDFLALNKGLIPVAGNRTVMYEYILLAGLFDKSISLSVVKPFDLTNCL